jgi:hypothetical protein
MDVLADRKSVDLVLGHLLTNLRANLYPKTCMKVFNTAKKAVESGDFAM